MTRIILELPKEVHKAILLHLLPKGAKEERAAFVFAKVDEVQDEYLFRYLEWVPVGAEGLEHSSAYYLELTDEMRGNVIKRAHDLGATIVEFHSHLGHWPAAFSESDRAGFDEFVPHVWWRLKGRGYAAVVVTESGFDALAWLTGPRQPQPLTAIRSGDNLLRPTALTLKKWSDG